MGVGPNLTPFYLEDSKINTKFVGILHIENFITNIENTDRLKNKHSIYKITIWNLLFGNSWGYNFHLFCNTKCIMVLKFMKDCSTRTKVITLNPLCLQTDRQQWGQTHTIILPFCNCTYSPNFWISPMK